MRTYRQLTSDERYALAALKRQGCAKAVMARVLGRHPSTSGGSSGAMRGAAEPM
jgi:IS30 family transposase